MDVEQAGPLGLDEAAAYQSHSIVSRMLLKKATGSVTLFTFDQGEVLSEHTSPFDALDLILEGEAEVSIRDQLYLLNQHDVLLLPAHVPHSVSAPARFKMLLTMIKSEPAGWSGRGSA